MGKGKLTTHVLDTATGKPAAGLKIALFKVSGTQLEMLTEKTTNSDGRCDGPILDSGDFEIGTYELQFAAGDYLKGSDIDLPEPLFLDVIPIRFGIADADAHYHVPLLLSPFGYSTYRGS